MAKTIPCARFYKVSSWVSIKTDNLQAEVKSLVHESAPEKPSQGITDFLFLGSEQLPNYTVGEYPEQMNDVLLHFNNSIKKVAGKNNMLGFFEHIIVYSLHEYVPLTDTAVVKQTSPTTYRIQSYEPTISPLVETALKKSEYGLSVVRDFDVLTVTIKDEKVFSKDFEQKYLLQVFKEHKHRLDQILEKAKVRYAKYPEAIETLKGYNSDIVKEMESVINARLGQTKA